MLTGRAWWLLIASIAFTAVGLLAAHPLLAIVGLAPIFWLILDGTLFFYRARCVSRGLRLRRQVRDERGPVTSLWAGRVFLVRVQVWLDAGSLPHVAVNDHVPFAAEVVDGTPEAQGPVEPGSPLELSYRIKAAHPGLVRFEGVRVRLVDLHGFFYHVAAVRLESTHRVLPSLVDAEGKTSTSKRYNLLPPPGIHRLPRPGSGSELLDLRDYLPGDPPKTIAWKVSARRDKLITKEFESEVPVRCTLFVDVSESVRLGPPGKNALTRLIEIAAGVCQANLSSRDLTGLCLFDEHETTILKPARTRRHLVDLFTRLADAAGRPSAGGVAPVEPHLELAFAFAADVYPEQLHDGVNHLPGWLTYIDPIPSYWVSPPGGIGRFYRLIAGVVFGLIYLLVAVLIEGGLYDLYESIPEGFQEEVLPPYEGPPDPITFQSAYIIAACLAFPLWMGFWRNVVPMAFSAKRRRLASLRKKMAALLARRYDLGPGGLELLLQDDDHLGVFVEKFLGEHHVPHVPRLIDRRGQYLFRSPEKLERLTTTLLRAVGKGHDNELFVLFVDLVELEQELAPLVRAVKVALSRHHQVMLVLPWPPDMDPPGRADEELPPAVPLPRPNLEAEVKRLTARRYLRAFQRVRRTFARLQVPVVCAAEGDPIQLILERIDRLRGQKRRRR